MQRITINKQSLLLGVYVFPLFLVVFSLSVPPGDLPLCGLMFGLAGAGFVLARRESRAWRLIWLSALIVSLLCGALEVMAGQRIARQRSRHESSLANPARAVDAPITRLFGVARGLHPVGGSLPDISRSPIRFIPGVVGGLS